MFGRNWNCIIRMKAPTTKFGSIFRSAVTSRSLIAAGTVPVHRLKRQRPWTSHPLIPQSESGKDRKMLSKLAITQLQPEEHYFCRNPLGRGSSQGSDAAL